MNRFRTICVLAVTAAVLCVDNCARGAISGTTLVASGLSSPTYATYAPGDPRHLFVLEKSGSIKIVDLNTKTVLSTPFLTIPDTDAANEGGLVGLAFAPGYATVGSPQFGKFYVYVTVDNGGVLVPGGTAASATSPFSTHIRQYSVSSNPLVANTTATEIMSWPRPEDNHVGGWIGFGKDSYLYINSGDGGAGYDSAAGHYEPGGNAQNITNAPNDFMGKQLRINVFGDAFPSDPNKNYSIPPSNPFVGTSSQQEIWAYGLRNPYRSSFDRLTGDQWIGDVGQDTREEIDFQPAVRPTVANYGWRLREGNIQTPTSVGGAIPTNYVAPVYDYNHGTGTLQGNAVIGGYVYRGPDPSVQGTYIFGDEVDSNYWEMNTTTFVVTNINSLLSTGSGKPGNPSSFGEDLLGNQYIVSYTGGSVYEMNTAQTVTGDYNGDGTVNAADYVLWRKSLNSTTNLAADGNHDGVIDADDYTVWRYEFGKPAPGSGASIAAAVPEPIAILIMAPALPLLVSRRRSRVDFELFLSLSRN